MIKIATAKDLQQVLELNHLFAEEQICNGIAPDTLEDLADQIVFVAEKNHKIVAYLYGNIQPSNNKILHCQKGDKTFFLEELYVLPEYRNGGLGKQLANFAIKFAKQQGCTNIQVDAVSKNYKSLMKFYIENLGFDFWSAWLVKKI